MGIYIFRRAALEETLSHGEHDDFGRHVIPAAVPRLRVQAHVHDGYWEDVGPPFSFWDAEKPIYTQPRFLPATKVHSCDITESLISEGSFIEKAHIERSEREGTPPIGIGSGSVIENAIVDKNARGSGGVFASSTKRGSASAIRLPTTSATASW